MNHKQLQLKQLKAIIPSLIEPPVDCDLISYAAGWLHKEMLTEYDKREIHYHMLSELPLGILAGLISKYNVEINFRVEGILEWWYFMIGGRVVLEAGPHRQLTVQEFIGLMSFHIAYHYGEVKVCLPSDEVATVGDEPIEGI